MNIKKDKNGQISSELILLIGLTLIFVLIIGKFIFKICGGSFRYLIY